MNKHTFALCSIVLSIASTASAQSIFQPSYAAPTFQNLPAYLPPYSTYQGGCVNGQCSPQAGSLTGNCSPGTCPQGNCGTLNMNSLKWNEPAVPTQTNYGPLGQREILPAFTQNVNGTLPPLNLDQNGTGSGQYRNRHRGNYSADPNALIPCMHPGCQGHTQAERDDFRNRMRSQFQYNAYPNGNNYPVNFQSNTALPTYQPNSNLNLTIQTPQLFNSPTYPTQTGSPYFK